ncbi:cytochrome c biogenesis protein ResB [Geomobilimonas luticola]|uniref:cytochrome c biogenesis protein ResB n=1 Tax=Geomobilimonas luticola TaxID=1114878 RepID=UPI001BDA6886|nr:cytochrome c biogenesis protein ResB [Geomobilimonas luticola]
MSAVATFSRLLLVSPWSLLVFLIIPLLVVLSVAFHVQLPFAGDARLLLINNVCFALVVAGRLLRYLAFMRKPVRYGTAWWWPRRNLVLAASADEVRTTLGREGYAFTADGRYGEKRDSGYLGTTVMYAGLLILLTVGCWDNLTQFSGVLLDGMGPATSLNKLESYRLVNKGPFASLPASLPRMQIINQYLLDDTYPMGATEVAFISPDGKSEKLLLKPRDPVSIGAYDVYMAKLVFEPQIVIKNRDSATLFDAFVTLHPLVQKRGVYSFYGLFQGNSVGGGVYFQPEKNTLKVVISQGDKKVVTDMVFQADQQVVQGDYILSCAKMGQWSEIHVVHRRHKGMLIIGGVLAVVGLLLRLAIRPQRVWLEEAPEGCSIWASGTETMNALKTKD